jgi:tight adherence protein C
MLIKNKVNIKSRIDIIKEQETLVQENVLDESFSQRALLPFYYSFSRLLLKATPNHRLKELNKRLERAGILKNSSIEKWLFAKIIITCAIPILVGGLTFLVVPDAMKILVIGALLAVVINTFFNFSLSKRIETRKKKILKDLPFTLDLITVSVEAGLSFDGAIARVVNNISGELCDEFSKALKEIRMGIPRKTALKNMSERCDVKELSSLITSLIQADELGVGLGRVLRIEAANLRERRKQDSREKAMKAPVKMLIPLIFFIFPSIFIIILGPAAIKVYKAFFTQ